MGEASRALGTVNNIDKQNYKAIRYLNLTPLLKILQDSKLKITK